MSNGNIEKIFGGAFSPKSVEPMTPVLSFDEQVNVAMRSVGLVPPMNIIFDGKVHRFDADKKGDKNCWYIFFSDGKDKEDALVEVVA